MDFQKYNIKEKKKKKEKKEKKKHKARRIIKKQQQPQNIYTAFALKIGSFFF